MNATPYDAAAKDAIRARACRDGQLIERAIADFYTRWSDGWPKSGRMIDGGSHSGYHAFRMAACAKVSEVLAFEAHPQTFATFLGLIDKKPERAKVLAHYGALQDNPDRVRVTFQTSREHPGRSGINPVMRRYGTDFDGAITVPALTIDRVVRAEDDRIRFVKLDLEGGEFAALRGGVGMLHRMRPIVVLENGDVTPEMNGYRVEDLIGFLADVGLTLTTPFGEIATPANINDFWYACAFPTDRFDALLHRWNRSFTEQLAD